MLPVSTKCACGQPAQLTRTKEGTYYVTCTSCNQAGRQWSTMTVAILDWTEDMGVLSGETKGR